MNREYLEAAIIEAERFLVRAFRARSKSDDSLEFGSPATSAVRRASMDLTRALAQLRRG